MKVDFSTLQHLWIKMQSYFLLALMVTWSWLSSGYALETDLPSVQGVNILTGELEEDHADHYIYERYQAGWNQTGAQALFLVEGDFRIGRIKTVRSVIGDGATHFGYADQETQVYDLPGRMSIYRYDHRRLIQTAEHYRACSLEEATLCCREHHIWQETDTHPHLVGWMLEDSQGETVLKCAFSYNGTGEVIHTSLSGHDAEKRIDVLYPQGWTVMDASQPLSTAPSQKTPSSTNPEGSSSLREVWKALWGAVYSSWDYLSFSCAPTESDWHQELQIPQLVNVTLATLTKALLGESTHLLIGPHVEETRIGHCGAHEINAKVRVTFINGILTTQSEMLDSLRVLSRSHGDTKIHYVFRPTSGWTGDLSNAILSKTGFLLAGFRSLHAHLLAQMWRQLIQEMGGIEGGGTIVHYTHSLGGTDTDRARGLLTPEEQKMIRVTSFGSATLLPNTGFQSVQNIVSVRDGVSCFDPLEYLRGCFFSPPHVHFQQSLINGPWPIDHLLNGPTYRTLLHELGAQFLAEFAPQSAAA